MINQLNDKPVLTGILIKDPSDNGYTAFFAELPEVIAEGDTREKARENLITNLKCVLDYRREESESNYSTMDKNGYHTESFQLELS